MKALTLTQPWGTLCIATNEQQQAPLKGDETRSWPWPSTIPLPHRIALHAGKGHANLRDFLCNPAYHRFRDPYAAALKLVGYSTRDPWWNKWPSDTEVDAGGILLKPLPLASIIALVTVVRCERSEYTFDDGTWNGSWNRKLGDFSDNRFVWRLEDQVELPRPIPCAGAQLLWTVPDDIVAQIAAQGVS